jgi:IclR helix-turn-helix domain
MNMAKTRDTQVRVDLDPTVPERVRATLAAVPGVTVRQAAKPAIRVHGSRYRLVLIPNGIAPYAKITGKLAAELAGPDGLPLVVADRLPRHVRKALEEARCSYADGAGAAHLVAPGLFLHVEPTALRHDTVIPAPRGLGAVGVRVIQTLLADHGAEWAVTALARRAGVSAGEAHRVVLKLQAEGLLQTVGRGPARRRRVTNAPDLLEWMARIPAARRIHAKIDAFLYARDPDELIARLTHAAQEHDLTYALTGGGAAYVMGIRTTTALPALMVRVPAKLDLPEAARTLGAEVVEGGENLVLVSDVGEVGIHGRAMCTPAYVAPPVRIWIDMLGEPRGEDAAALFREAALGF